MLLVGGEQCCEPAPLWCVAYAPPPPCVAYVDAEPAARLYGYMGGPLVNTGPVTIIS